MNKFLKTIGKQEKTEENEGKIGKHKKIRDTWQNIGKHAGENTGVHGKTWKHTGIHSETEKQGKKRPEEKIW